MIHAVRNLALKNTQVGMIRCRFTFLYLRIVWPLPFLFRSSPGTFLLYRRISYCLRICHITNFETFSQFIPILCLIICNNIITGMCLLIDPWFKYWFTLLIKTKNPIFNVIWTVKGDIPILYLRSKYHFWSINKRDI